MARNMIRIGEPKQVSVNREQDKTRFVYSMSEVVVVSDVSQKKFLEYDLPADTVITSIGITIKRIVQNSTIQEYPVFERLDPSTQVKLSVKNLDRVVIQGYAGAIDKIFGEGFIPYAQLFMSNGVPPTNKDTIPFYGPTREGFIGRELPVPLMLKKGDMLQVELDIPGETIVPSVKRIIGLNIIISGYWVKEGSFSQRKMSYYRTQLVDTVNNSVLLDIPTMSKVHNIGFLLSDTSGHLLRQGFESYVATGQVRFSTHLLYLMETIVSFTYNRGNSGVDLVVASGINDYAYSRYLFPIEQVIQANYEMMTARVQPAAGYTSPLYIEQIGGMYVYFEYEPITTYIP